MRKFQKQCLGLGRISYVTCTPQNVSSHASELLSQEGHVGLDNVHPLSNSHSGLETNKAEGQSISV